MLYHVMGQIARGILAAAILYSVAHQIEVFLQVDIEGGHCPVTLGLLGLLLHAEYPVVLIEFDYACALELLDRGLFMAHDTGGVFLFGEVCELGKTEKEQVIGCHDEHIVIDVQLVHGIEQIAHCTKARFVRLCSIVENRDFIFQIGLF